MNSLKKISDLAARFEKKLLKVAQQTEETNLAPAVVDAFFDPNDESNFSQFISQSGSKFSKALLDAWQSVQTKIDATVGATVNAPAGTADFLLSTSPALPAAQMAALKAALNQDYVSFYKNSPSNRIKTKLSQKKLTPPTLNASNPSIITGLGIG